MKPAVTLPITRVVLFNSGVGYFSRIGEVTDDARVDLTFPEQDINDLLKSMVLEDFNGGRIAAVSYDSREPISRTLSSFAINLNNNPTFAGIVSARCAASASMSSSRRARPTNPASCRGVIVGVEKQKVAANAGPATIDVEVLNMWCAEGLRTVKLPDIQQLKFANPVIESEFRRALEVLSLSHDSQKKAVSLHFAGDGKRKVQVGYVIEAPIWKTSYRLVLGEKEKPYLQGWAMVENPTDEDWAGVKMALVSGRPISFKMDLYNPLYVNRPTVEPELFASLRPVTYRGGFGKDTGLAMGGPPHGGQPAVDFAPPKPTAAAPTAPGGCRKRDGRLWRCRGTATSSPKRSTRRRKPTGNATRAMSVANSAPAWTTGTVGNAATAGGAGRLLPVHDRPPGLAGAPEERHAPHRRQGRRGAEGLDLQPVRAGEAPALGPEVQEHLRCAPEPGPDHGVRGQRLRRRHPRARRAAERGATGVATRSTWAPKSIRKSAPARRRSPS